MLNLKCIHNKLADASRKWQNAETLTPFVKRLSRLVKTVLNHSLVESSHWSVGVCGQVPLSHGCKTHIKIWHHHIIVKSSYSSTRRHFYFFLSLDQNCKRPCLRLTWEVQLVVEALGGKHCGAWRVQLVLELDVLTGHAALMICLHNKDRNNSLTDKEMMGKSHELGTRMMLVSGSPYKNTSLPHHSILTSFF